jgi:hypothetical protein
MAKSSKSQNPEFLEKRRNAIVELAKRRGQGRPLMTRAVSLARGGAKVSGPIAFAVRPQPQN